MYSKRPHYAANIFLIIIMLFLIPTKLYAETPDPEISGGEIANYQTTETTMCFSDMVALNEGLVIVGDTISSKVFIINALTKEVKSEYQLNDTPGTIAYDSENQLILVNQFDSQKLAKICIISGEVTYIELPYKPRAVSIGESNEAFVASENGYISVINISQNLVLSTSNFDSTDYICHLLYDKEKNNLYGGVSEGSPRYLFRFSYDELSNEVKLEQYTFGMIGCDLRISGDGKHIFFITASYTILDINPEDIMDAYGGWDIGPYPRTADFHPNNKYLAASNGDEIKIYSMENHVLLKTFPTNHYGYEIKKLRYSPDQKYIIWYKTDNSNRISQLCYMENPGEDELIPPVTTDITFSDMVVMDEEFVIVGDIITNKIYIINFFTKENHTEFQVNDIPDKLAYDSENGYIFVTHRISKTISKIDISSGAVTRIKIPQTPKGIVIGEKDEIFVISEAIPDGYISVIETNVDKILNTFKFPDRHDINYLAYDKNNNNLLCANQPEYISPRLLFRFTYDEQNHEFVQEQYITDTGRGVELAISKDGNHVSYGDTDYNAKDITDILGKWADSHCVDYSPDNKYIVTASINKIMVYSVENHELLNTFPVNTSIYKIRLSPTGRKIIWYEGYPKRKYLQYMDNPYAEGAITITATDTSASEQDGDIGTFAVTRNGGDITTDLIVKYTVDGTAINGEDYDTLTGIVTIQSNNTTAYINVHPIDDNIYEETETVIITLSPDSNYSCGIPSSASITIEDNDKPTISITAGKETINEAANDSGSFIVTRSGENTTEELIVTYTVGGTATAGIDYKALTGTAVIPVGQSTASITLIPLDGPAVENEETVIITLNASNNYIIGTTSQATITIVDDDVPSEKISAVYTLNSYKVKLNNGTTAILDMPPFYLDNVVMVPMRGVAIPYELYLEYDAATQSITFRQGADSLIMFIGSKGYIFNGSTKVSEVPPIIKEGRTFVPLKLITEEFGFVAEIIADNTAPVPGNNGTLEAENETSSSVSLKWEVAADDIFLSEDILYRVYYSKSDNIGTASDINANGTGFGEFTTNISSCTVTGLAPDTTYYFNVVVKDIAENENAYFTVSTKTKPAPPPGGGGGGGGGIIAPPVIPPAPPAVHPGLENVKTSDDTKLSDNLKLTGEANLDISKNAGQKGTVSGGAVVELLKNNLPLTVANQDVSVKFTTGVLNNMKIGKQEGSLLELGAKSLTPAEKEQVLATANLGASTGIFEIGGKIIDLSAQIKSSEGTSSKITAFAEPVEVRIDLSDLNLNEQQIKELCGIRLEKDAAGNTVAVKLGGTYDPETNSFTFFTDKFSLYSVLQVKDLVTISVTLDIPISIVNGISKPIDVPPTIINNRTMVPLRFIGEALGAEVNWIAETQTVIFRLNGKELEMVINQPSPGMDTPPTIIKGRTFVPLRFISESLGADVTWYPSNRTVSIVK